MRELTLTCKACNKSIIQNIRSVSDNFELSEKDEEDVVPALRFSVIEDSDYWKSAGHIIFNLDDFSHLPKDKKKIGYGCCGYSDCEGPNLFCFCGEPLGYKYTDCYVPRMAILIPDAVALIPSNVIEGESPNS